MGWGVFTLLYYLFICLVVLRLCTSLQYLRAAVTHGKRGEHKPRNGDRVHTSVPVYLLMVLQGHREGVALLVVWHHDIYHNVSSSFTYCIINYQKISLL